VRSGQAWIPLPVQSSDRLRGTVPLACSAVFRASRCVFYATWGLRDVPYNAWRTYDPENTLRFYGLRLHEVGMIKNHPQKIIAQGTDWRFLNEVKKELKA
jgi:hypothetical protein